VPMDHMKNFDEEDGCLKLTLDADLVERNIQSTMLQVNFS